MVGSQQVVLPVSDHQRVRECLCSNWAEKLEYVYILTLAALWVVITTKASLDLDELGSSSSGGGCGDGGGGGSSAKMPCGSSDRLLLGLWGRNREESDIFEDQ